MTSWGELACPTLAKGLGWSRSRTEPALDRFSARGGPTTTRARNGPSRPADWSPGTYPHAGSPPICEGSWFQTRNRPPNPPTGRASNRNREGRTPVADRTRVDARPKAARPASPSKRRLNRTDPDASRSREGRTPAADRPRVDARPKAARPASPPKRSPNRKEPAASRNREGRTPVADRPRVDARQKAARPASPPKKQPNRTAPAASRNPVADKRLWTDEQPKTARRASPPRERPNPAARRSVGGRTQDAVPHQRGAARQGLSPASALQARVCRKRCPRVRPVGAWGPCPPRRA